LLLSFLHLKKQIESLCKSVKPVEPDKAIGRLTRMEAIGSKAISEAVLNSAQIRLAKLETALDKVENAQFGVCIRCSSPIPTARMLLMPESTACVTCAENKQGRL
jgi:DnaK suppressor protein